MKKKILIIDDEKSFTQLLKMNLEETGRYEVLTENRGLEGLSAAKRFKPDLIFLDIIMPDISGGEVGHQLRNDPMTKDIPVVFLTAVINQKEVESRDGFIGGYPFVSKPISIDNIISVIEKHIIPKE